MPPRIVADPRSQSRSRRKVQPSASRPAQRPSPSKSREEEKEKRANRRSTKVRESKQGANVERKGRPAEGPNNRRAQTGTDRRVARQLLREFVGNRENRTPPFNPNMPVGTQTPPFNPNMPVGTQTPPFNPNVPVAQTPPIAPGPVPPQNQPANLSAVAAAQSRPPQSVIDPAVAAQYSKPVINPDGSVSFTALPQPQAEAEVGPGQSGAGVAVQPQQPAPAQPGTNLAPTLPPAPAQGTGLVDPNVAAQIAAEEEKRKQLAAQGHPSFVAPTQPQYFPSASQFTGTQ